MFKKSFAELFYRKATAFFFRHRHQNGLHAGERRFLISLVANQPEWASLGIPHAEQLPGMQWNI
jgi:hypothetical protein